MGAGTGTGGGISGTGAPSGGVGLTARSLGGFTGDERRPQHNHGITDPGHTHAGTTSYPFGVAGGIDSTVPSFTNGPLYVPDTGSKVTGVTINNDGTGLSQNIQPSTVINFIIKH
jgi:hypothetical protein